MPQTNQIEKRVPEKNTRFKAQPAFSSVPTQFVAQCSRTPDAVALVGSDQTLTYQQLNQSANQLAHFLQSKGLRTGQLVAVQLTRSPKAIITFLSLLKLGAAYIPIDPNYPEERRNYILQDSQAAALITESDCYPNELPTALNDTEIRIQLDTDWPTITQCSTDNLNINIQPETVAYVIYTSGTTGKPKGVMIPHRGLSDHAIATVEAFSLTDCDRVLQFSSLSFDIIVEELYPTLISGASIVLRPEEIATSLPDFLTFIAAQKISILNLPTAFWHELVSGLARLSPSSKSFSSKKADSRTSLLPASLRLVVVGGEKTSQAVYAQWREIVGTFPRWFNTYGPTEITVSATLYDPLVENYELGSEVPIGRSIGRTTTYILNDELEQVKPGNRGELYIGGPGLAIGYLNRPKKTAAAFVNSPFGEGDRLYKTGDLVRQLPDGNLEFMGRADSQVKIRGFRIELSGIESCLEKHPLVQQQIVVVRRDSFEQNDQESKRIGPKRLVAYVVPKDKSLTAANLKSFLAETLPSYMVPSAFVLLDHLPTNTHGKVDKNALPAPEIQSTYTKPKTNLEKTLVALWEIVLSIEKAGTQDNFFELGGNSLRAVHLFSLIEEKLKQKLPLTALIQAPTPASLAAVIEKQQTADVARHTQLSPPKSSLWDSLVPLQTKGNKPPLFFLHAVGPSILNYQNLLPYLDADQPVYALQTKGLDEKQPLLERMDSMAAQYIQEIKTIQPQGPYHLAGHSFGGLMAFEMAQQLQKQGEQVGLLGLFDSATPALSYCQAPPTLYNLYIHAVNFSQTPSLKEKWNYIAERAKPVLRKLLNKLGLAAVQEEPPLPEIYRRIEEIDRQALRRYSPQPYPGKMTLFRAQQKDPKQFYDAYLGWQYLIEGELEIHDVPGHHMSLMLEPHVKVLATELQQCLNRLCVDLESKC